jgi:hypothetical protein
MITQYYSIIASEPDIIAPGQFVFHNNESDEMCGFIYKVTGPVAEIVLFEPSEIADNIPLEILELPKHWSEMLRDIKDIISPGMRDEWARALEP